MNPLQLAVESLEPRLLMSTLYWLGGSGNWNGTDANWNTAWDGSGCTVAWSDGDDAVFENSAAITVTLSSAVDTNSLTFGEYAGVTLTGGTLTLSQITVYDAPATVNSVLSGPSGLNIDREGCGSLTFTGANTYTGTTTTIDGGGITQFNGSASAALSSADCDCLDGTTLGISGVVLWSGSDVSAISGSEIDITGNVTVSGGTWDLDSSSQITVESGASLTINGGRVATGQLFNYGSVALQAGSLTVNGGELGAFYNDAAATLTWTGGALKTPDSGVNAGHITINGGSNSLAWDAGGLENGSGTVTWNSGELTMTGSGLNNGGTINIQGGSHTLYWDPFYLTNQGGTVNWDSGDWILSSTAAIINCGGNINLQAGTHTLTLDGTTLVNGDGWDAGTINWSSGTLAAINGGSIVNDDADGATFTVDSDAEVTLDVSAGSLSGTITNGGTLHWLGTGMTGLPNLTNTGTVVFDNPVSLVTLTGDSTITSGDAYTLTIGAVSSDIAATVTGFDVDWGDGTGFDSADAAGDHTHTYPDASGPTQYTVNVRILTATGAYVGAATKVVTVIPPSLTVASLDSSVSMAIDAQSFTPDVLGPNGSGSLGSDTSVNLTSITIGFATADTTDHSLHCFIYSVKPANQDDVGGYANLVAASISYTDGSALGEGSHSRTYNFNGASLDPTQTYFICFDSEQYLRCQNNPNPYTGGNAFDTDFASVPLSIQFQVTMDVA